MRLESGATKAAVCRTFAIKRSRNASASSGAAILTACAIALTGPVAVAQGPVAQGRAKQGSPAAAVDTVTVRMSNFAFDPEHLRLRVGVPVRLLIINESGGGHDFSAPAFFAASDVTPAGALREGGIEVARQQTVELTVVPRKAGSYRLECNHFLHSLFGMTGTVEVVP